MQLGEELGLKIEKQSENRGPGAARNTAVKKTQAEWIHFHDADDLLHPDYLEKTLPYIDDSIDLLLTCTDYVAETDRKHLSRWHFNSEKYLQDPIGEAFRKGINTTSSLIRKTSFIQIGGFNEKRRCWEDVDMHLRLVLAGSRIRVLQDVLCTSIRHDRGVSSQSLYFNKCRQEFLFEYEKYIPQIRKKDLCNAVIENSSALFNDGNTMQFYKSAMFAFRLNWSGPESNNYVVNALLKIPSRRAKIAIYMLQLLVRKTRKLFCKI